MSAVDRYVPISLICDSVIVSPARNYEYAIFLLTGNPDGSSTNINSSSLDRVPATSSVIFASAIYVPDVQSTQKTSSSPLIHIAMPAAPAEALKSSERLTTHSTLAGVDVVSPCGV